MAWLGALANHQQNGAEEHQDSDEKRFRAESEANPQPEGEEEDGEYEQENCEDWVVVSADSHTEDQRKQAQGEVENSSNQTLEMKMWQSIDEAQNSNENSDDGGNYAQHETGEY